MSRDGIIELIEPIKKAVSGYEDILSGYIAKEKIQTLGYAFPLIPPEITSAFGIETLKLPESLISRGVLSEIHNSIYKAIILPESDMPCCRTDFTSAQVYRISYPAGYGEDAAVALHNETSAMLKNLFNIDLKKIDIDILQKRTGIFEKLRRSVRSITSLLNERQGLLSADELNLVFEVSLIFPPDISLGLITPLLQTLQNTEAEHKSSRVKAMIYGGRRIPADVISHIESRGIDLAEDDTCTGRRLFDISLNADSEYLFYELLDAYSYRPMSPCTKKAEERYELLYRLLRNYGINLLIFYKDNLCGLAEGDINYLRIRMMRDGIDPLVIDESNYIEIIENYMERI